RIPGSNWWPVVIAPFFTGIEARKDSWRIRRTTRNARKFEVSEMRRVTYSFVLALVVMALSSAIAAADTIHSINVTFSGNTVTASGDISGLGSKKPAFATLQVNGFALYNCANKGGNEAPGQNPVPATSTSPAQDLGNTENNGRGTVNL